MITAKGKQATWSRPSIDTCIQCRHPCTRGLFGRKSISSRQKVTLQDGELPLGKLGSDSDQDHYYFCPWFLNSWSLSAWIRNLSELVTRLQVALRSYLSNTFPRLLQWGPTQTCGCRLQATVFLWQAPLTWGEDFCHFGGRYLEFASKHSSVHSMINVQVLLLLWEKMVNFDCLSGLYLLGTHRDCTGNLGPSELSTQFCLMISRTILCSSITKRGPTS